MWGGGGGVKRRRGWSRQKGRIWVDRTPHLWLLLLLSQCHLEAGDPHNLGVGILSGRLLLAHEVLEDVDYILVVQERLLTGLGLLLGRQKDH